MPLGILVTILFNLIEGRRDRDRMLVGYITTCAISVYHH
jgi:hypothetical protein